MERSHISSMAILLVAMMALGCVGTAATDKLTTELMPKDFKLNASDDVARYANGTCMAVFCKNKTPDFPAGLFYGGSLKGGECNVSACNDTVFNNTVKGDYPGVTIGLFMFGAGQSFMSFDAANVYCNNSMRLAVKWLVGNSLTPYPMPTRNRTECFLEKNVIPVYVLYSNFTNANASRAAQIAQTINGAGPAIIISESELDDSNASNYALAKDEVIKMKAACPKCRIALGIKLNGTSEYNVTRDLFSDASFASSVDMVAYGLNSHYFSACDPDVMKEAAIMYSKYLLYNFTKPSLMSYVLFDQGNSSDNSCKWASSTVGNGYSGIFIDSPILAKNGIIGAALYSTYGVGPFTCESCALIDPGTGTNACSYSFNPQPVQPRFFDFMGFCQIYYTGLNTGVDPAIPLVFSNGSVNCNFAFNPNIARDGFINKTDTDVMPNLPSTTITAQKPFFSCAACVGNGSLPGGIPEAFGSSSYCTEYSPSVEIAADSFDMDPTLLRAALWQESDFDKCARKYVPLSSTCNPHNLNSVADPAGCCAAETETYYVDLFDLKNPEGACKPASMVPSAQRGTTCKPCGYGLGRTTDYPYTVYQEYSESVPAAVKTCAMNVTGGYPAFNPYQPYDAACSYAYKFMNTAMPSGTSIVNSHTGDLNIGSDSNKKEWYAIFFALDSMTTDSHQSLPACHAYSETASDWINHFAAQKSLTSSDCSSKPSSQACQGNEWRSACCGNADFLDYVKKCELNNSYAYAYDTLSKYAYLGDTANCANANCPENTMEDMNTITYLCTNGYMETECCTAANSPLGYSATYMCLNPSRPVACDKYCH